jgi:hypothetical protein
MEEEVRHSKSDKESIREFRLCTKKVRIKLHEMVKDMYANLQVFQQLATHIMVQHSRAQAKNTKFTTIREGLNEMQHWITENPDAPSEFPCISEWERNINYVAQRQLPIGW